jgi:hypothetical protein
VPVSLERVCLKAMAKRPEDRYQTALEMRQDLDRVRAGQPVSVVGVPLAQQTTQALGEQPRIAENPTTMLGGGSTMAGDRSLGYGEEFPARRRSSAGWVVAAILALLIVGFAAFLITRALTSPTRTTETTVTTEAPTTSEQTTQTSEPTTTSEQTTTTREQTTTSTTERSTTTTTERSTTTSTTRRPTTTTSGAATTATSGGPTTTSL